VPVRVFVIAAVRVYEEGLKQALAADSRFDVRGSASSATGALMAMREVAPPPDLVLLDCAAPEGRDGARLLRAALPSVRLVALGLSEQPADVVAWVEAGALGLVSTDASLDELSDTLLGVARGEAPCSPRVAAALLRRVSAVADGAPAAVPREAAPAPAALTAREREIAWLLNHGLSNKEIAGQLQIELGTVKNHVHNLLRKLGVSRRSEAAALLRRDAGIATEARSTGPRI
jgi:DNA-binding NarL/FixJ family response regulator